MDQTLRQLGDLLLGSIPTVILFVLTYAAYRLILHKPLERVLHERHERTTGAMEKARADALAAESRAAEYEQRLREAKLVLFKSQDERRKRALDMRTASIASARARAAAMTEETRMQLEREKRAAEELLQAEAESLAAEIIRTILKPVVAESRGTPAGGAR